MPGTESIIATKLTQTRDAAVWASSATGLYRFADSRIERYAEQQGLPADAVFDAYEDHAGTLWAGTSRGLAKFDGRRFTHVPLPVDDSVHVVVEDRQGAMWLGLERRGVVRVYQGRTEVYGITEGLAGNYALNVLEDKQGNMWVGFFDAGLTCLRQTPFTGFGVREGLPSNDLQAILETRTGEIWLGTSTSGLARLAEGRLDTFTTKNGLPDDVIMAIGGEPDGRSVGRHAAGPLPHRPGTRDEHPRSRARAAVRGSRRGRGAGRHVVDRHQ